jgi:thioredoxin 1
LREFLRGSLENKNLLNRRPFLLCQQHLINTVEKMSLIHTSDEGFESDVLQSEMPVLVDFWAEWCGPCKAIAPILDELQGEYQDRLKIAKLDVDSNQKIPPQFGIRSIPTLILFKNGVVEAQHVGATSKRLLKEFLDSNL